MIYRVNYGDGTVSMIQKDTTPVVACTLSEHELDVVFYAGFGGCEGEPFTLWTEARVYFPVVYDGAEWCGSAPRNPCEEKTAHQGG
jgi:hypothetical protein